MAPYLLLKAIGFFLLVIVGIPGNTFIILQFTYILSKEKKLVPSNIILSVLALANVLVIFSRIIPQSLNAIGVKNLLDDIECKFSICIYRIGRAMSICVTSLLSCYQCILIAPTTRVWVYLKSKVTKNIMGIIIILWIINFSIYPYCFLSTNAKKNVTNSPYTLHLVYCDTDFLTYTAYIVNGIIYTIRDAISLGLMTLASSYMVFILLSHEKNVKAIRSSNKEQKLSAEIKASRAVILLVVLYVLMFGLDNSMWVYTLTLSNVPSDMNDIRIFLSSSYAALSPILIILSNPKLHRSWMLSHKHKFFQKHTGSTGTVYSVSE
ncbi:PREDICTED: vomeronasal type-1 receptor 3-like [Nanorana parkeri]|uniref:vomeronasal type-1 receptor 3-like n=1 Tax=Nanorana parkeri TaxID=125878 RepID=UPI00085502A3|nr:PREDICTED: vomeronasal type-1 receptor 3-like [Nanorana parkeri]